jgi:hypothetical protein
MGNLSDWVVKTLGAGRHDDGDGLRLIVSASGKRPIASKSASSKSHNGAR